MHDKLTDPITLNALQQAIDAYPDAMPDELPQVQVEFVAERTDWGLAIHFVLRCLLWAAMFIFGGLAIIINL